MNKSKKSSIGYDGKTIPKILMVSSAAFGIFSAVNQYLAIPSAVFGLAYNAINDTISSKDIPQTLNEELIDATRRALCATRSEIMSQGSYSKSQIGILNELMEGVVQPQNLKELIKKTESYQQKYCTVKDADDIISSFENHFRVELAKNDLLSRYYTLTSGVFTADKIQIICAMLEDDSKTLNRIVEMLNGHNTLIRNIGESGIRVENKINRIMAIASNILNEFALIMVAVSVFLTIGIIANAHYNIVSLLVVMLSYGISNLIVASLINGKFIFAFPMPRNKTGSYTFWYSAKCVFSVILPMLLPLPCFLLLNCGINLGNFTSLPYAITVFSLLPGGILSFFIRTSKQISSMVHQKSYGSDFWDF